MSDRLGDKHAPSTPNPSGDWKATDRSLWKSVLEVASGGKRHLTRGDRTINSPNNGSGYRNMPQNPMGIAWAVKQYNGFGGNWGKKAAFLTPMRLGAVVVTVPIEEQHWMLWHLQKQGLVKLASVASPRHYWEITHEGARIVRAGLGGDLTQKMRALLQGPYDKAQAQEIGLWLETNFRIQGPQTPRGQRTLKKVAQNLIWALKHGDESYRSAVESDWAAIQPKLSDLVRHFTDEGGKIVPKELKLGGRLYINEAGLDETKLQKYAQRLEAVFGKIKGWRTKSLKGTLKVVLASPRNFRGTSTGTYRSSEDALYIRTTPKVLKRDAGYAGFEYIIVHELGHRYERAGSLPDDFDRGK